MRMLVGFLREVMGFFVDDGLFAFAILGTVVLAALVATVMPRTPIVAGAVLVFGCLVVLLANVIVASRR
jgi:hypothetical protein